MRCDWMTKKPWITFVWMFSSGLVFGLGSYNIFSMFKSSLVMVVDDGAMAIGPTLGHLFTLILYGIISLFAYVIFKACEKSLVDRLLSKDKH